MRKTTAVLIMLMFCLGSVFSYAQSDSGKSGGQITLELDGNLFVQDDIILTPTFLKVRYFINDDIAVRLSTWFQLSSDQTVPEATLNYTYFAARPGVEYHLASSPGVFRAYVGAEVIVDHAHHSFDTEAGMPVTGAWTIDDITNFQNRGFLSLGGVAFGGAELYKGSFFIGTELGLAYAYTMHSEVHLGDDLFLGQSKSSHFGIDLSRIVRIGVTLNGEASSSRL
jgi:hypothetical protein